MLVGMQPSATFDYMQSPNTSLTLMATGDADTSGCWDAIIFEDVLCKITNEKYTSQE